MENLYLSLAIHNLKPGSEFSLTNDDYSTIKWDVLEGDAPTAEEVEDAIKAIKTQEAKELELKATAKAALLERLGITEEEAKLLVG